MPLKDFKQYGQNLGIGQQSAAKEETERRHGKGESWPDKHRPDIIADVAMPPHLRLQVEAWLKEAKLPHHVILHGPPGLGKTTIANVIARHFFPTAGERADRILRVNASEHRGIDSVRDDVAPVIKACGGILRMGVPDWWSLVVVSEADGYT